MRARYLCGLPAFLHYSNSIILLWFSLYPVVYVISEPQDLYLLLQLYRFIRFCLVNAWSPLHITDLLYYSVDSRATVPKTYHPYTLLHPTFQRK